MEIEFDEDVRENNLLDDIKNHKKAIIIISAVLVFIMLICYGCYKTMLPTDWHHFNSERIAFVEDKYKISLDNAKPERYWVVSIAPDGDSSFKFEVDDYKKFMENDFHGKAILNSYEEPDGSDASYKCRIDERLACRIKFNKSSGKYKGMINCYRDPEKNNSVQSSSEGYTIYSVG